MAKDARCDEAVALRRYLQHAQATRISKTVLTSSPASRRGNDSKQTLLEIAQRLSVSPKTSREYVVDLRIPHAALGYDWGRPAARTDQSVRILDGSETFEFRLRTNIGVNPQNLSYYQRRPG
jgi:hypothetical protein